MSGVVVWVTGLPASGKSSFARRLVAHLRAGGRAVVELDGDEVRERVFIGCGFDEASRGRFYEGLAQLAALLARQRLTVVVPATAHRRAWRRRARELAPAFVEVYLDVPSEVCEARDPRGLYRRARAGELACLPGVGAAYEVPEQPDVVASGGEDIDAVTVAAGRIEALESLGAAGHATR